MLSDAGGTCTKAEPQLRQCWEVLARSTLAEASRITCWRPASARRHAAKQWQAACHLYTGCPLNRFTWS